MNATAARDIASYLHPYTNLGAHEKQGPLVIARGEGVRVFDDQGRAYLDGMAGLWCVSLGFSERRLVEAATRQLERLPYYHTFGHKGTEPGAELAERLIELAPAPMSKVFFTCSGSEAVDSAVKLVWYYQNACGRPRKKKIISRQRAYHGVTVAAASLTGLPHVQREFDLPLPGFLHADCPHYYRYGQPGESEDEFAARCVRSLEVLILAEGPETIGAFIAEPVMGAGGVIPPPRGYFEGVQQLLRRHEILFIADEVITGFGRTGEWFGSQTYELVPDMITLAKQLSSGYQPIGALLISEPIYRALVAQSEKLGVFGHGYTYGGHPVAAAVALETLRIYEELDLIARARGAAAQLREGLLGLAQRHPLVGEVRGIGMLWGVELVEDRAAKRPFDPARRVGAHAVQSAERAGLITRAVGDTLCFAPPLVISAAEVDELLERLGAALAETAAWLGN